VKIKRGGGGGVRDGRTYVFEVMLIPTTGKFVESVSAYYCWRS